MSRLVRLLERFSRNVQTSRSVYLLIVSDRTMSAHDHVHPFRMLNLQLSSDRRFCRHLHRSSDLRNPTLSHRHPHATHTPSPSPHPQPLRQRFRWTIRRPHHTHSLSIVFPIHSPTQQQWPRTSRRLRDCTCPSPTRANRKTRRQALETPESRVRQEQARRWKCAEVG